jgi:hypothetical protein
MVLTKIDQIVLALMLLALMWFGGQTVIGVNIRDGREYLEDANAARQEALDYVEMRKAEKGGAPQSTVQRISKTGGRKNV